MKKKRNSALIYSATSSHTFIEALRDWFLQNRRAFLWRERPTPYAVWVSEVMLQQTQAERVAPYFVRWMSLFADPAALAQAKEQEVIKAWEGLGYYSRARALRKGAIYIITHFDGVIPNSYDMLLQVPGIGPYTASALMAFGFHKKKAAVDANVFRVLTRFFAIDDDIGTISAQKKIRDLADSLLPEKSPWEVAEALIELGAIHCTKTPDCTKCPLKNSCKAFSTNTQQLYPKKARKIVYEKLYREVFVITHKNEVLLRRGRAGKVFAGLYQFPYVDTECGGRDPQKCLDVVEQSYSICPIFEQALAEEKHSFTRFRATLYPKLYELEEKKLISGHGWYTFDMAKSLPFASGHRKVFQNMLSIKGSIESDVPCI